MIDAFFTTRDRTLNIYGLPQTIKTLRNHLFNDEIWPDFTAISLLKSGEPAITMKEIRPNERYEIDEVALTPFETSHTVKSVGYVIEKEGKKIMFTSDTGKCANIWNILNGDPDIASIIIEVSFPSAYEELAICSGHLTPKLLNDELANLKRNDITIYVNHIKPDFIEALKQELLSFERTKKAIPLSDGALILL
jgi:cAMP phosphodiesterase